MTGRRRGGTALLLALAGAACGGDGAGAAPGLGTAGAAASTPTPVAASEALPTHWGLGADAPDALIAAWDLDVGPDGSGLPPGRGTAVEGAQLYQQLCASCHGLAAEGQTINPALVVRGTPEEAFRARGIGEFWPYATTLYDYIRRSMPQTAPGTLTPDQVYALVAFLLAENGRIGREEVVDQTTLPAIEMPGRSRFVMDDRTGGPIIR